MGGQVLFHDALAARLDLIKPSRNDIDSCLKKHPLKLTQGVKEFISKLHGKGIPVYLVSGGFRQVRTLTTYILQQITFSNNYYYFYIGD